MTPLPRVVAVTDNDFETFTTEGEDPDDMSWCMLLRHLVRQGLAPEVVDAWIHPGGPGTVLEHETGGGTTTLRPAPGAPGIEPWEIVIAWPGNLSREPFEGADLRARVVEARALRAAWLAARVARNTRPMSRRVTRDAEGGLRVCSDTPREEPLLSGILHAVLTLDRPEEAVAPGGPGYHDGLFFAAPDVDPTDDEREETFGMREPWAIGCQHWAYTEPDVRRGLYLEGEELRRLVAEASRLLGRT